MPGTNLLLSPFSLSLPISLGLPLGRTDEVYSLAGVNPLNACRQLLRFPSFDSCHVISHDLEFSPTLDNTSPGIPSLASAPESMDPPLEALGLVPSGQSGPVSI